MDWRIVVNAWNDPSTKREVRAASSRKIVLRLNVPSTLAFSMMGEHREATYVTELVTDAYVTANNSGVLRARCGNTQDQVGESGHGVAFSFVDYRGVLQRRKINLADNLSYNNVEQSDIVWGLITTIQARTNGNYGITRGLGSTTGIKRQWNPLPGQYAGKIIDEISNMGNGFDWDVSPSLVFDVYYPSRGSNLGVGIEYGKSIGSFTRTRNPSSFANDDLVTGGPNTSPVEKVSATIATDPMGRWDGVFSFPDVNLQSSLDDRGTWVIGKSGLLVPAYSVKLVRGFWRGLSHIGLGDTVRLVVKKGRINDNMLMRVAEISIDIDDDGSGTGAEEVRLSLVGG